MLNCAINSGNDYDVFIGADKGNGDPVIQQLIALLDPALEGRQPAPEGFTPQPVLAMHEYMVTTCSRENGESRSLTGVLAPWHLRRVQEYMFAHLAEGILLDQIAGQCGLSVNHFVRAFRRSTGTTPHRWLMLQRLKGAMRLMQERRLTLAEIAAACGFCDQSHLTRVFTVRLGITPGQFRRSCFNAPERDASLTEPAKRNAESPHLSDCLTDRLSGAN